MSRQRRAQKAPQGGRNLNTAEKPFNKKDDKDKDGMGGGYSSATPSTVQSVNSQNTGASGAQQSAGPNRSG